MSISSDFRAEIIEAIRGKPGKTSHLQFLKNFNKAVDGADASTPASVSTKMFADTRTLAASASENLDLSGTLAGLNGAAVVFTKVHAIWVRPAAGNTNKVNVGGAASNGFLGPFADATDVAKIGPGREFFVDSTAGWTVTAGTGDILKVANDGSGTGVTYDIVVIGE